MDLSNFTSAIQSNFGDIDISGSWIKAGIIIGLIFLLLLVMAKMTRGYMSWYTNGWWVWTGLGFLLAVVIEGFFVISGSTIFTSVLSWDKAPKPIQTVLNVGNSRLSEVLGESDQMMSSSTFVDRYIALDDDQKEQVKSAVCSSEN